MELDLTTFEAQIDGVILQRGQKYFKEGAVTNLEELVKGHWYAEVAGTDTYEVEITLSRSKVKHYECSCPYDLGPVCKHVVAVLYTLKKNTASAGKGPASKTPKAKNNVPTKKQMLQEILDNVSFSELKAFILAYALKKNEFGGMLLARFADQTGVEGKEKYVLIIKNAIGAGGRSRFIEYPHVTKVMKPVKELLQQAHDLFARKYYAEVVNLCQAVIEEISALIPNMDDSAGHGGGAIEDAFALLFQLSAEPIPQPLQEALFTYALQEADKKEYRYNGSYILWYELLDKLAQDKAKEEQVVAFVEDKLQQQAQKEKTLSKSDRAFRSIFNPVLMDAYDERHLALYLVNFYLKRNQKPAADAIMQKYRHIPQFRQILIKQALQAQQYPVARQQVQEALALAKEQGFGSNEGHWDEWLLRIAEAEKNTPEVRAIAAALFYRTYNMEYYRKYKQTYPAGAWPAEYEKLVKKVLADEKGFWGSHGRVVPVFIEEQDWEKLFDYVRKQPSLELLMQVGPHLQKIYTAPLLDLFQNALFDFTEKNVNTPSYHYIGQVLQYLLTLEGGKPVVAGLLADFRELFKKRRNLMAELDKITIH